MMPNIDALFKDLVDKKGSIYVASKLDHGSTSKVERWVKTKIPGMHLFSVYDLLKAEGVIND